MADEQQGGTVARAFTHEKIDKSGFEVAVECTGWLIGQNKVWRSNQGTRSRNALLLADAHVVPSVLEASGFTFAHPDVASAFEVALREG